jgi:hypothetical protein
MIDWYDEQVSTGVAILFRRMNLVDQTYETIQGVSDTFTVTRMEGRRIKIHKYRDTALWSNMDIGNLGRPT